jgi:hypothetical protein
VRLHRKDGFTMDRRAPVRRTIRRAWMAAALGGSLLAGCERSSVRQPYPPDPLLAHKTPVTGKIEAATPQLAYSEPVVPSLPATVLASAPRKRPAVAPALAQRPNAPSAANPAPPRPDPQPGTSTPVSALEPAAGPPTPYEKAAPSETKGSPTTVPVVHTQPAPAACKPVPGTYGHAPDYAWLQGVLDKHYHGHLDLRYCDPTMEDDWGGKVCLEEDPRLKDVKEGDVIFVEGEIVVENGKTKRGAWNHYPNYRIRNLEIVRHKD